MTATSDFAGARPQTQRRPRSAGPSAPAPSGGGSAGKSISAALLVVFVGVAGALWFSARGNERIDVVALTTAVHRGDVVKASDLTVARIAVDGVRARVATPAVARQAIVGHTALTDLVAGTMITPEMVGSTAPQPGEASVGIRLSPDELPSAHPRPGDWVQVVAGDGDGQARNIGGPVQVTAVDIANDSSGAGSAVLHLVAPVDVARAIAGAAGTQNGVRLLGVRP